jgi:Calx-beta domain
MITDHVTRRRRMRVRVALVASLTAFAFGIALPAPNPVVAEVEGSRLSFPLGLSGVAVDRDDGRVVVEEFSSAARVSIIDSGTVVRTVNLGVGSGRLAYDDVRNRIYVTAQTEGRVLAINADTGSVVGNVFVGGTPVGIEVDPVSGRVFVARNSANRLTVLDGPTLATIADVAAGQNPIYLVVSDGGDTVYVSNQNNTVTRHQAPGYGVNTTLPANAPAQLVLDESRDRLYVTSQNLGVVVVDTTSLGTIATMSVGARILDAALTPDGSRLVGAVTDREHLAVFDTTTFERVSIVGNVPNPVFMATDPRNGHIYAAGGGSSGTLVEVVPSTPPANLPTAVAVEGLGVEGDPGLDPFRPNETVQRSVTIALDEPSTEWVEVSYTFDDVGSATAGTDFYAYESTALIPPGETSVEGTLFIRSDTLVEGDETLGFRVTSAFGALVDPTPATVTIIDDDAGTTPLPVASLATDITVDENAGPAVVDVYLDQPATEPLYVYLSATASSATNPADFTTSFAYVLFPAGVTAGVASFDIVDDGAIEPDESFSVAITNTNGAPATFDSSPISVVIADDDSPPAVLTLGPDIAVTEGTGVNPTLVVVPVVLDRPAPGALSVQYRTTAGTATDGVDYTGGSEVLLEIPAGATSSSITIPVVADSNDEFNETFSVALIGAIGNATLGADVTANVSITDDDAVPSVTVNDVSATEGAPLTFTLTLSTASAKTTRVSYTTVNGTASTNDYTAASGTATFPPGTTTATVTVTSRQDTTTEPDETFQLRLSSPIQMTIADASGVGTIVNDDLQPTVTVNGRSIREGNTGQRSLQFTVTLSSASASSVVVNLATANGTAVASGLADYRALTSTVTFSPGQTSRTVSVVVFGDRRVETDETFQLVIQSVTGAASGAAGTGTITNDD